MDSIKLTAATSATVSHDPLKASSLQKAAQKSGAAANKENPPHTSKHRSAKKQQYQHVATPRADENSGSAALFGGTEGCMAAGKAYSNQQLQSSGPMTALTTSMGKQLGSLLAPPTHPKQLFFDATSATTNLSVQ